MRVLTIVGFLFWLLWPLQATATVVSPDMGTEWMQVLDADAFYKRGRGESPAQARGRAGPQIASEAEQGGWIPAARIPPQAEPKHQGKTRDMSGMKLAGGTHGPRKAHVWMEPERKGLSLVGQIQLVSAPRPLAASAPAQVGFLSMVAGVLAIILGLTMAVAGYLASAQDARIETAVKRGPHARAALRPYARS